MLINVSRKHIKTARKHSCQSCPVALAIAEQTHEVDVKVFLTYVKRGERRTKLSKIVQMFIRAFDDGRTVKPFVFRLGTQVYSL